MNVKEAIARAKELLKDFYAEEEISGVRLEEVEFDEHADSWLITLGILRPAATRKIDAEAVLDYAPPLKRTYKLMRIPNATMVPPSMKIREFHADE